MLSPGMTKISQLPKDPNRSRKVVNVRLMLPPWILIQSPITATKMHYTKRKGERNRKFSKSLSHPGKLAGYLEVGVYYTPSELTYHRHGL